MAEQALRIHRQPKKRVAVFIDGTWNVEDNNTNVWRIYSLCSRTDPEGMEQSCFYTKGVGTAYGEKIRGGWFGFGIDQIITDAYEWLVANYNPGDDVFIFGFSRGAYAARALAGFITLCGVLRPGSPVGVGELFARYKAGDESRSIYKLLELQQAGRLADMNQLEQWMLTYSTPTDVTMVGVWDTVGALAGEKGYLETGLRLPLLNAYHAMAIDEHRAKFEPTLYTINRSQEAGGESISQRDLAHVEQRWFVGAHANVGGGYDSDVLPQPALAWLMRKASALGFAFREPLTVDAGLYTCKVRDSFREFAYGLYAAVKFWRPFMREIGASTVRTADRETRNVNETIDGSVFERWRENDGYRPKNLADWAAKYGVDPAHLRGARWSNKPTDTVPD